ncbi:hypothetical protein BHM03_00018971 [Ensete ventricosum]|nr:hypothetical protein BHM03_00018971 [Ensete ventricosum]
MPWQNQPPPIPPMTSRQPASIDQQSPQSRRQQRSLTILEGENTTVHEEICDEHIGGRTLAFKVFRLGYYWSTMRAHVVVYIQKSVKC